jgi:molecular chaperone DnaJ
MATLDYYRILGVTPKTTPEEIRRRYRVLARQHHPDRNPDDPEAAARFRLLAEAYKAIQVSARNRPRAGAANYRRPRFTGNEELFEEFFGITAGASLPRSAGPDFRYDLSIPFAAAIRGMETVIQVDYSSPCLCCQGAGLARGSGYRPCPDCQGQGYRFRGPGLLRFGPACHRCRGRGKIIAHPCPHCQGSGHRLERREYHLHILPGTTDGTRLRIKGQGGEGFQNGPRGNLEVVIHVAPDDFFTRVGNDLYCQIKVSFALAALGGLIRIPTLDGYRVFNLPKGTQTGWTFRFPGAGAPGGPHGRRGDQVNRVVVITPQELSPQQRELLEEFTRLERDQLDRAGHE